MASIKLKGDTSGEVTISAPAVAGTTTLELPATSSTLATQNSLGVRNLIINGDMRIAQRGTSKTGVTGISYPAIDRYRAAVTNSSNFTMSQSTDVPDGQGLANSLKMECTTADASSGASTNVNIQHRIEAQNLQHLMYGTSSAKKLTLSFWVKSNKTGTYTIWIYQQDSNRQFCPTYTIDSADTWEKKTITIDGDTAGQIDNNNGDGLRFGFFLDAGSDYKSGTLASSWEASVTANRVSSSQVNVTDTVGNDWYLTGVQLEVGTEATPFEHRPYDMELQRCQRYYFEYAGNTGYRFSTGYVLSSTQSWHLVYPPTTMRASPDLSYANFDVRDPANAGIPSSISIAQVGPNEIYLVTAITGGTAGNGCQFRAYADNAYMKFSAEL